METSGPLKYRDGYKYVTHEAWSCVVHAMAGHAMRIVDAEGRLLAEQDNAGRLTVHAGYAWDGASGPTIDTPSTIRGSLAHDVYYQALRAGLLQPEMRAVADSVLRELCAQDGMWFWRAAAWWAAVRKFAASSARRQRDRVLLAPR